jgi:hypothetical protein
MNQAPGKLQPILGGVNIQGDTSIASDLTGRDHNSNTTINTGVGPHVEGGVHTAGGDFVGQDKITNVVQPPPPVTALHQLPPPLADFTGRKEELAELRAAVELGGATI